MRENMHVTNNQIESIGLEMGIWCDTPRAHVEHTAKRQSFLQLLLYDVRGAYSFFFSFSFNETHKIMKNNKREKNREVIACIHTLHKRWINCNAKEVKSFGTFNRYSSRKKSHQICTHKHTENIVTEAKCNFTCAMGFKAVVNISRHFVSP